LQGFLHFCTNLPKLAHELDIGWLLKLRHSVKPLGHTFTQSPLAHDWQVPAYSHCSWTWVWFQCQADLWSAFVSIPYLRKDFWPSNLCELHPCPSGHDSCGIHYKHHIVGNFMWHLHVTLNMYCDLSHYTEHGLF
jgi:hypothetical protein